MRFMDPMLPFLGREFHVSLSEAGQTITYFSIAYAASLFFVGAFGDRYGKLQVTAWSCVLCGLAAVLCAIAPDFLFLKTARLFSGAASSAVMTLSMAWLGDVVPYERRQSVLSRLLIGMSLGVTGGILIGGFAADDVVDWRLVFVLLAAAYMVVGAALVFLLRSAPSRSGSASRRGSLLSASIREYCSIFQLPWARVLLSTVALEGAFYFGALAFIPFHLNVKYGITLSLAGSIVMLAGLGGLFFSIGANQFLTLGERRLIAGGGIGMAASLVLLGFSPTWLVALPACFCAGMGFYMCHSTLQANATQMDPKRRGASVAAFSSCFFIGQSAGVALFGRLIERTNSTVAMGVAAVGVFFVALFFAMRLKARSTSD